MGNDITVREEGSLSRVKGKKLKFLEGVNKMDEDYTNVGLSSYISR